MDHLITWSLEYVRNFSKLGDLWRPIRPFVWSWSRLSQLVDLQHPQWGWQELAKHGLPRGCAEHNLLLMMQASSAMARMTDVWRVFFIWISWKNDGNFGRTPQKFPGLIIEPTHWLARTWLHAKFSPQQVFSEFKGELGGSETASFFQRSQRHSAPKKSSLRCRGRRNWKMPCNDLPRPWYLSIAIRTESL